ncbi:MAG TPA: DUF559 domain-containing protein, partial [Nitrospirae bacterium]|nr:DUF559 domain-containing protein [Nitrospirota bacterium]
MPDRLRTIAKELRKRSTDAEKLLWKYLRLKQLEGLKFRRQQPIDNYLESVYKVEPLLFSVIPACPESLFKKDSRLAS